MESCGTKVGYLWSPCHLVSNKKYPQLVCVTLLFLFTLLLFQADTMTGKRYLAVQGPSEGQNSSTVARPDILRYIGQPDVVVGLLPG